MMFWRVDAKQAGLRIGSRLADRKAVLFTAAAFFSLLLLLALARTTFAETTNISRSGNHVLTIYDNGVERGLLTEADTLREALAGADIAVGEYDITEPGLDEQLLAATYDVNIYRARPVAIQDGSTVTKVMTAYRTGAQIAKQAGVTLQSEDKASLQSSNDVVRDGAVEKLVIDRATKLKFVFYGVSSTVYTHADTVQEFLSDKDIELNSTDKISPQLNRPIVAGMTIDLWREGKQNVTREETIKAPVRTIEDADQKIGYRKVQTAGVDGEKLVTYEIVVKNGREVSKKVLKTVVTKQPKQEVVIVGTKPALAPYSGGGSKDEWLTAAGIDRQHWAAADYIISQESGWNPNAINPTSGACGLAQALPCTKVPGNPLDPVDSLTWMNSYVYGRYGGWEGAVAFKQVNGWY